MMGVIFLFFNAIAFTQCQSPCPGFFNYVVDNVTRETYGRIEIPHPPRNVPIHLRVSLSISTILPTQYVGKLELAKSRRETVKAIEEGRSLHYNLHFPLQRPLPLLTEILFNNHQYCIGRRAVGPIITNMFLEHTLYPPGVNPLTNTPDGNFGQNSNKLTPISNEEFSINVTPSPSLPIYQSPTVIPQTQFFNSNVLDFNQNENCGKSSNGINQLIANGSQTWPGQWPWLAAVFVARRKLEFQCAGNLITVKHVITAAHCRISNGNEIPANLLLISLGRYRLDDWHEHDGVTREVEEFRIHPEYTNRGSAHADLAIVTLRERVQTNSKIAPVCLWRGPTGLEQVVGKIGYVVGWGKDERGNQHSAGPRLAKVPIVSQEDCLRSNLAFVPSTSNKTFCAGRRDGSGPCNGDSGSGLMIHDQITDRYYLRGIVSLSLLDKDTLSCDLSHYVVYVDAGKYVDWIRSQIT